MTQPTIGMRVTLWARPAPHVILLFAKGTYAGNEYVNGQHCPVVHLDNGHQTVLIWSNVYFGMETNVNVAVDTFKKTKGHVVMQWSLDDFIAGKLPDPEAIAVEVTGVPPAPKTTVDVFHKKLAEIEVEEKKKAVFQKGIDACDARIAAIRVELVSQRDLLMKELAAIDKIATPTPSIQMSVPEVKPEPTKPAPIEVVESQASSFDTSAARAALED